jgi:hypothetical protein
MQQIFITSFYVRKTLFMSVIHPLLFINFIQLENILLIEIYMFQAFQQSMFFETTLNLITFELDL